MNKTEELVLDTIKDNGTTPIKARELAELLDLGYGTVRMYTHRLQSAGRISGTRGKHGGYVAVKKPRKPADLMRDDAIDYAAAGYDPPVSNGTPVKYHARPNHYVSDSLGDPETCAKDHNHPPKYTDGSDAAKWIKSTLVGPDSSLTAAGRDEVEALVSRRQLPYAVGAAVVALLDNNVTKARHYLEMV